MKLKVIISLLFCCLAIAESISVVIAQENSSSLDTGITEQKVAIVSIPSDDEFYVGKEKVTRADIPEKVKQVLKDIPPDEQIIYVKARCPVKYGVVVSVVDALREAGFTRIGLVTEKGSTIAPGASGKKLPAGHDRKLPNITTTSREDGPALSPRTGMILIEAVSKARVRLNSKAMSLPRLQNALKWLLKGRSDKTVSIKAPKGMLYCDVLKVVGAAKEAGAQPIGLQVDYLR
jgi:biopolymer transport protein ExbD